MVGKSRGCSLISLVSFSESRGGAAKAAQKVFLALRKKRVSVQYVVVEKFSNDESVIGPGKTAFFFHFVKRLCAFIAQKCQLSKNSVKHSLNLFSCGSVLKAIRSSELVHLNWINNETIALEKIPCIKGKIIITLHDEWFYCGSEHIALENTRFVDGYASYNKNVTGFDWDRMTWIRKKNVLELIRDRVVFTVPSEWMLNRARESKLLRDSDIRIIPNYLETDIFKHVPNSILQEFGVSASDKVILFGAVRGANMRPKGFHLLKEALLMLADELTSFHNIVLVTFGGEKNEVRFDLGFRHIEVGYITDKFMLAQIYSSAHLTVVPSLLESFGQVAAESLSCETPVIAFDCSGLRDIVQHKVNGYLAKPYSATSLCEGMKWLLMCDSSSLRNLGANGRVHIEKNFSEHIVITKLIDLYREYLGNELGDLNGL